jgi:hypothetical protein
MPDDPTTQTLPPLAEPPTPERIRELSELLATAAADFTSPPMSSRRSKTPATAMYQARRHAELQRKKTELTRDDQAELALLEGQLQRAHLTRAAVTYELAGLLAVSAQEALRDAESITESARKILGRLPQLTGFTELPEGGWREAGEQRVAMFERRAAKARRRLDDEPA